jgi:hypothetical protein
MRKQCLEFALPKPGEICNIWQVLTIQTVIPVGFCYLTFECENKQRNQYNGASLLRNLSQKSSALWILFEGGETLAIYDPTDIVAKKPQGCEGEEGLKKGREKKESP